MFDFRPTAAMTQFSSFSVAATSIVVWLLLNRSTPWFAIVGRVNPFLVARFEVLTAMFMMCTDRLLSKFGGVAVPLEGSWILNVQVSPRSYFGSEDAGIRLFRNVGSCLPVDTVSYPNNLESVSPIVTLKRC